MQIQWFRIEDNFNKAFTSSFPYSSCTLKFGRCLCENSICKDQIYFQEHERDEKYEIEANMPRTIYLGSTFISSREPIFHKMTTILFELVVIWKKIVLTNFGWTPTFWWTPAFWLRLGKQPCFQDKNKLKCKVVDFRVADLIELTIKLDYFTSHSRCKFDYFANHPRCKPINKYEEFKNWILLHI